MTWKEWIGFFDMNFNMQRTSAAVKKDATLEISQEIKVEMYQTVSAIKLRA
jgi:hypothetical protein